MLAAKFDPQSFFQRTDNVALHVPAAELFSLLKRSLNLPPQWAALVGRTTGDHATISPGGVVEGDGVEDVLFVRSSPVDVQLSEDGVVSKDGFTCAATIRLRVGLIAERGELQSFLRTVVGSRRVVQAEGIALYFQSAVRSALAMFAGEHGADQLVEARIAESAAQAVVSALEPLCFAAGLSLERAPSVKFDSASFHEVQKTRERAAARQAEHDAAQQVDAAIQKARTQHLDQLAGLLDRLRGMAAESTDVELPELIRTFSERQRGELYEALFAAEAPATRTRWIVVAAGDELIFFDGQAPSEPVRRLRVDGAAGPARSVQFATGRSRAPGVDGDPPVSPLMKGGGDDPLVSPFGKGGGVAADESAGAGVLWVGAATGVYRWPIDHAKPDLTFLAEAPSGIRGGFNAVAIAGERLVATHSEIGICEWDLREPSSARRRFESMTNTAKAVRNAAAFESDLLCSIDERVIRWPSNSADDLPKTAYMGSASVITALAVESDGVYAGNSDGDILFWPNDETGDPQVIYRGRKRAAESVWVAYTRGVRRLFFADTSHQIHAQVIGDSFACHYEAGGQTLRRVEVAPDLVVATNELRDRLICWTPGKPDKPFATINVAATTGRSIQDVCLV